MGEERASVLDAPWTTEEAAPDVVGASRPARAPRRFSGRAVLAVVAVAAIVIGGGVVAGVVTSDRIAHDDAVVRAEQAQERAADATAAQRVAAERLQTSVSGSIALRDSLRAQVIAHQAVLGGADALAPLVEADAELEAVLAGVIGVDEVTSESLPGDAAPLGEPAGIAASSSTEVLRIRAVDLAGVADRAAESRSRLSERADAVDAASVMLAVRLAELVATLPAFNAALLASHPLASADSSAAATAALGALDGDGAYGEDVPSRIGAYATAVSAVIASHDAETARRAAEAAAQAARKAARGGSGSGSGSGGGGAGTAQRGVLTETNSARAANGLGALAWNGTLASRACSFAAELAAKNGSLYHSSFAGGFSAWGENVAYGFGSPAAVVAGWMGSAGHRANILGGFTVMGACSATSATGRVYWVQQFGA